MSPPTAFCAAPFRTTTPKRQLLPCTIVKAPRPRAIRACQNPSQKPVEYTSTSAHIPRRQLLSLTAALTGMVLLPPHAQALSKKRILAKAGPPVTLPSGITYRDISIGKGYTPRPGDSVAIHYSLFFKDLEVESSRESQGLAASPVGFTFGATSGPGSIMRGISEGMDGMKVGGLRLMTVPPELAFGQKGRMPLIPSNATVDFAVSLLSCKKAGTNPISVIDPKAQVY